MSFWRFSRSSRASGLQATSPASSQPSDNDRSNTDPPPYSDLSQPTVSPSSPVRVYAPEYHASSRRSVGSLGSQMPTPSYTTYDNDPDAFSITSSTTTLTAPPRYSSWSHIPSPAPGEEREGSVALPIPEHTFDICGGFKSEPWATLRLYDARPRHSREPRKGKNPRFTSVDTMLGNVELRLSGPQTIKSIELTLNGSIVTGSFGEGGSMTFLEQGYTLWDRKFGDPRALARDQTLHGSSKYDGKLSGNWLFPFSIPFPTSVDLATLHAISPEESEGPVRFLPEFLDEATHVTPFNDGASPTRMQPIPESNIAPFDVRAPHTTTEKGRSVSSGADMPTQTTVTPQFTALDSLITPAPNSPSLEPYTLLCPLAPDNSSSSPRRNDEKRTRPPAPNDPYASHSRQGSVGTSMRNSETPASANSAYSLPQSFLERDVVVSIRYELTLTVTHGMFTKKSRVNTPLTYLPVTIPRPMSAGRERAYREREMPPGPDLDAGGWKQLPPTSIRGTFCGDKVLTVDYSLSLAMPLSFARGTVLPCCLSISCSDVDALDAFADPSSPQVRLRRSICFLRNQPDHADDNLPLSAESNLLGGKANPLPLRPKISSTPLELSRRASSRLSVRQSGPNSAITPFALSTPGDPNEFGVADMLGTFDEAVKRDLGIIAVWCKPERLVQEPHVRRLYGEIALPRDLQPTCRFPLLNVLYHIDLLAPATDAFAPDKSNPRRGDEPATDSEGRKEPVYLSHFVEITTGKRKEEPAILSFVEHC